MKTKGSPMLGHAITLPPPGQQCQRQPHWRRQPHGDQRKGPELRRRQAHEQEQAPQMANTVSSSRSGLPSWGSLKLQQGARLRAGPGPARGAIRPHHAVARHQHRDRVAPHRRALARLPAAARLLGQAPQLSSRPGGMLSKTCHALLGACPTGISGGSAQARPRSKPRRLTGSQRRASSPGSAGEIRQAG